jgi:hypothetical protein
MPRARKAGRMAQRACWPSSIGAVKGPARMRLPSWWDFPRRLFVISESEQEPRSRCR